MQKKEQAKKILGEVPEQFAFWVNNGPVIKNLTQLEDALMKMKDDTFQHHVTEHKNDFYNWINDVIGDNILADRIAKVTTKKAILSKITRRLASLKKVAS